MEAGGRTPLRPADPGELTGVGRRLHDLAARDGQDEVARLVVHAFGAATCPACGVDFAVAERVFD